MAQEDHHIPDIAVTSASIMLRSLPSRLQYMEMPLEKLIPFEDFTLESLGKALEDAVIDWQPHDEQTIYVTGLDFPTFWKIDQKRQFLIYYTFLDVSPDADDTRLLEFANSCNYGLMLVQFSFHSSDDGLRRLYGHHTLPLRDGVNIKQVIRTGRIFADIFDDAADDGFAHDLLIPIGGGMSAEPDVESATKH
jgi:hypothetical protein